MPANQPEDIVVIGGGERIYSLMKELWPICRSITGPGVRESLGIIKRRLPELNLVEVPTGTKCFDWTIPQEWLIRDAYIIDPNGKKFAKFSDHNLHVVNYSKPVNKTMSLDELKPHLHSLPEQPEAIPYVTSYYKEYWGFCLKDSEKQSLIPGNYQVVIDSELKNGSLTYAELFIKGKSEKEVLISTYICHPSMANNELSGPTVTTELSAWLSKRKNNLSYRIVFVPETIGAITYLSKNLKVMKERTVAGFVINCVGDDRAWSFMPSKEGNTLSDKAARHVLKHQVPTYKEYSFLTRGSDERQYCSPGIDLPVASIMRSKYATFPEYHTSLDDLHFVSAKGLGESFLVHQRLLEVIDNNFYPLATVLGEPKMSDRGLRPTLGKVGSATESKAMMDLLMYADGKRTLLEISDMIEVPAWDLAKLALKLQEFSLLELRVTETR